MCPSDHFTFSHDTFLQITSLTRDWFPSFVKTKQRIFKSFALFCLHKLIVPNVVIYSTLTLKTVSIFNKE